MADLILQKNGERRGSSTIPETIELLQVLNKLCQETNITIQKILDNRDIEDLDVRLVLHTLGDSLARIIRDEPDWRSKVDYYKTGGVSTYIEKDSSRFTKPKGFATYNKAGNKR